MSTWGGEVEYPDYFLWVFGVESARTIPTNSQTTTLIMMKKTVNDINYLSFLFANKILPDQHITVSIVPNTSTKIFVLSIPCTTGVSIITAKNT
jgi:hypothetical protein